MLVISSPLLTLTARDIYTDHRGTDDQCSPINATCQCPSMPPVSTHQCQYQCPSVHINATYQ
ncbi:unnamed protein product [Staurois parvus]|uniref:Uncharacterized protein n=1 Tax=Staurois parvus TaxID=386267 RepID=A0ABN9G3M1_9NEOB|nr:unnamed protein product [Staurois parvus]